MGQRKVTGQVQSVGDWIRPADVPSFIAPYSALMSGKSGRWRESGWNTTPPRFRFGVKTQVYCAFLGSAPANDALL
jgi:hypothetical protein